MELYLLQAHTKSSGDGKQRAPFCPSRPDANAFLSRLLPDGALGSPTTTLFPLPPLAPPTDGLIALLDAPTIATLHVPVPLRLVIRNARPTRAANITVHIEFDAADGFVLAGLRSGRVPVLLPGAEEELRWNMVPVECGLVRVPRIRVVDRRVGSGEGEEGEEVEVVDLRRDARAGAEDAKVGAPSTTVGGAVTVGAGDVARKAVERKTPVDIAVLVLP